MELIFMAFTEKEFAGFNREYRLKKVVYALQRYVTDNQNFDYIAELMQWFNHYEGFAFEVLQDVDAMQLLLQQLKQQLFTINPFLEQHLFDKSGEVIKVPVTVMLDNVRTPFNVGSILRSAEAFAVEKIVLTGMSPTPQNNSKVAKSQKNAAIDYEYFENTIDAVLTYKNNGYMVCCLEKTADSQSLKAAVFAFPLLLVIGNEEFGITADILEQADVIADISLYGNKNSLNASVAAGIALSEIVDRYSQKNNLT